MNTDVSSIGPAPAVVATDNTADLMEQQKQMSLWTIKVNVISNCLKSETEGNLSIARNLK